ncbi:MAG: PKD domain-containing protein [Bacteroidia bacterium]|nr:PKD domain-containing protein [Bacteroidia bacterium]
MKTHYNIYNTPSELITHRIKLSKQIRWYLSNQFVPNLLLSLFFICTSTVFGQTYKFTTAGATARLGPTQAQINSAYSSTNLDGKVTSISGIQSWRVPDDGTYQITVAGAKGGDYNSGSFVGGKGATIQGTFDLNAGEEIYILVGQKGINGTGGGGGGGSYVVNVTTNTILIVAGGGGGAMNRDGNPGLATNNGTQNGGTAQGVIACAGGGYKTDGALSGSAGSYGVTGGKAFLNGGAGGLSSSAPTAQGGFGGGGGAHSSCGGSCGAGGGGGYNGGSQYYDYGDGGGSYNSGVAQTNTQGNNNGDGYVEILTLATKYSDIEVLDVQPVIAAAPGILCHNNEYDIDVTLRSNGPGRRSMVDINISMPGASGITIKHFELVGLEVGETKVFRIPGYKLKPTVLGNNSLTFTVLSNDMDNSNNAISKSFDVTSLPFGANFNPDIVFPGFIKNDEPDLVTHDKVFIYHFSPPIGYSNSGYGTTWTSKFEATIDGTVMPSNRYSFYPPSGSTDAYVSLKFNASDVDLPVVLYYTVTDKSYGKCDTTTIRYLHIAPMPSVAVEDAGGCLGTTLQFVNLTEIASGTIISTFWDFGDGTTSTQFAPQKLYASKGIYTVKMVATSDLGFADSVYKTIEVIESPVADFTFKNQCGLNPFQFTNNSTLAAGTMTYVWNFGDENESTLKDPTHVYTQPGPYQVTLTATSDNGCHSEITKSVYNYPNPVANFTSPASICQNSNVTLSNLTTIPFSSWGSEWTIGSNNVRSFDKNPLVTFTAYGEQLITLKTTSQFGCVDSMTKSIVVMEAPIINFSTSDVCSNSPIIFNSGITNIYSTIDFIWNIDGILYADREPSVKFDSAGEYNMSLTVNYDNGCSAFKASSVRTGYRPNADFDIAQTTCAGNTLQLANNTTVEFGNFHSFWDMGDGMTYGDMTTPLHTYSNTSPESYVITLIASSKFGICPDTISKTVNVGIIPSCDFTINHDWTFGQRGYTFDVPVVGADYKWYFGDGVVSTAPNPNHQYSNDGKFKVKLIVTSPEGCQCEKTLEHVVQNLDVNSTFAQLGFELFPNPSNGIVTIANNNNVTVSNIAVSNMVGETVLLSTQNNTNAQYIIDLSNMANGVYLIRVTTHDNQVLTHKVIIAK